jgi:hypothetical protein
MEVITALNDFIEVIDREITENNNRLNLRKELTDLALILGKESQLVDEVVFRANFLVVECKKATEFYRLREAALESYKVKPRKTGPFKRALELLRDDATFTRVMYIYQFESVAEAINCVRTKKGSRVSRQAKELFEEWAKCCPEIVKRAATLRCDGCRVFSTVLCEVVKDGPNYKSISFDVEFKGGRPWLGDLKKMAVALKEWWEKKASESALRMVPTLGRKKGNHYSDPESIIRDGDYKFEREQSYLAGVSKSDTGATVTENPLESAGRWVKRAYASYLLAKQTLPGNPTDRVVYEWLNENDPDWRIGDLMDYELPSLQTWIRYVGDARNITGTQKNTPRHGRDGSGSVFNSSDI